MTTSTTTPRLSYTADGSTAAFTFNFEIADSSSIDVYVGSTLKTLTTDYTVSFDSGTSGTGTVTFTSAPSSGTVTLIRNTNLARTTDFENSGAFLASTVNAELDRLSQAVIDATDKIENRAVSTVEPNTDTATLTIPAAADRANKILSFDSSGNAQATTDGGGDVTLSGSQTLTNKTLTAPVINGAVTGDATYATTSTSQDAFKTPKIKLQGDDAVIQSIGTNQGITLSTTGTGDVSATSDIIANGDLIATSQVKNDAITIGGVGNNQDAFIQGRRSNENITIDPAGTGTVELNANTNVTGTLATTGTITPGGNILLDGNKVTGGSTAAPSADGDLANKKYVDDSLGSFSANSISQLDTSVTVTDSGSNGKIAMVADGTAVADVTSAGVDFKDKQLSNISSVVSDGYAAQSGQDFLISLNNSLTPGFVIENSGGTDLIQIDTDSSGDTIKIGLGTNTVTEFPKGFTANGTATFSGGTVAIDNLNINDNIISSDSNADIRIEPGGTGKITSTGVLQLTDQANLTPKIQIAGYSSSTLKLGDHPNNSNQGNSIFADGSPLYLGASGSNNVIIQSQALTVAGGEGIVFAGTTGGSGGGTMKDVNLDIINNKISSTRTNENIELEPNGTGVVTSNSLQILGHTTGTALNIRQVGSSDQVTIGDANNKATIVSGQTTVDILKTSQIDMRQNDITTYNSNADLNLSAQGSGTVTINGLSFPTADGSANQVLKTDGSGNLSFVAQSAGTSLSGSTNNTITTVTGADAIQGEANLTFDGSTLAVTGAATVSTTLGVTGASTLDGVTITDNTISSNASNANLEINANGSGTVVLENLSVAGDGATVTGILDEDAMGSDSAVKLATQQSIKAYVDAQDANIASDTLTFTNKTFDVEGTGNSISNIDVADLKSGVLDTDLSSVSGSDDTLASAKAIKAYVDANSGGGASTGDIGFSGNSMSTSSSNADFEISANGTGAVIIAGNGTFASQSNGTRNALFHKDHAQVFGTKTYANRIEADIKIDSGQSDSSSSNDRFRNVMSMTLDLNGKDSTASNSFIQRGPTNFLTTDVVNSASGDSVLGNASGNNNTVFASTTGSGDLTISTVASNTASLEADANSGTTITLTDARIYNSNAEAFGSGTENITNLYHFKANATSGYTITNEFGFHTPDSMKSLIGGVTLQNGDVTTSAISLVDNKISSNRSNDSLHIEANGTGQVELGVPFDNIRSNSRYNYGVNKAYVNGSYDGATRIIANSEGIKATATQTTSSTNFELRAENRTELEMAGFSFTSANEGRGLRAKQYNCVVGNDNSSTASTIGVVNPVASNATLFTSNGNITATNVKNYRATLEGEIASGKTGTFTTAYNFHGKGPVDLGEGGTTAGTNYYGLYIETGSVATNNYGVWINDDAYTNKLGGVTLAGGTISTDGISIVDNEITASRSNDDLEISANGTGRVQLASNGVFSGSISTQFANVFGPVDRNNGVHITQKETIGSALTASSDRRQGHLIAADYTLANYSSSDKDNRYRAQTVGALVDLNGATVNSTNTFAGVMAAQGQAAVVNTDASNAGTIGNTVGMMAGTYFYSPQTVNCTNAHGVVGYVELDDNGGAITVTNAYVYKSQAANFNGTITNGYSYYIDSNDATNKYGFYDTTNSLSRFGAVQLDNQAGDPTHGADKSFIYAKDESSSSEVFVKDEAGNVTKISPHNKQGEWEYFSRNTKTGKTVRVNMERMIKDIEKLTGQTYIESE